MKRFIQLTCLLLAAFSAVASTVILNIPCYDSLGRPLSGQVVVSNMLTPQTIPGGVVGGLVFKRDIPTNGIVSLTNLVPSQYSITHRQLNETFIISFTNETGTLNAADLKGITTNAPNSLFAYSRTEADARFYPLSNPSNYAATASVDAKLDKTNGLAEAPFVVTNSANSSSLRFTPDGTGNVDIRGYNNAGGQTFSVSSRFGDANFSNIVTASQFAGDGSGLSNIGTNSMSAEAYSAFIGGGGGGEDRIPTNNGTAWNLTIKSGTIESATVTNLNAVAITENGTNLNQLYAGLSAGKVRNDQLVGVSLTNATIHESPSITATAISGGTVASAGSMIAGTDFTSLGSATIGDSAMGAAGFIYLSDGSDNVQITATNGTIVAPINATNLTGTIDNARWPLNMTNNNLAVEGALRIGSGSGGATFSASLGQVSLNGTLQLTSGNFVGNGGGLTTLSATELSSGFVPWARLTGAGITNGTLVNPTIVTTTNTFVIRPYGEMLAANWNGEATCPLISTSLGFSAAIPGYTVSSSWSSPSCIIDMKGLGTKTNFQARVLLATTNSTQILWGTAAHRQDTNGTYVANVYSQTYTTTNGINGQKTIDWHTMRAGNIGTNTTANSQLLFYVGSGPVGPIGGSFSILRWELDFW